MSLHAFKNTLHSKRFWLWQVSSAVIYALPAMIRLTTGSVVLPILGLLEIPWVDHWIPGNLIEKILVNSFFPGGAGAVAGEIFFTNRNAGRSISRQRKYGYRLVGALIWVTVWSIFQLFGFMANIIGSYGGNIFEYPGVYPLNYLLASLSIFTPTIIGFIVSKLSKAFLSPLKVN